jgi:tRNA A22 N-methylase
MLEENHQYYTIIVAEPGTESYKSDKDYKYGRLLLARSDPILVRWWEAKLAKLLKNIVAIEQKVSGTDRASDNANMKLAELKAEVDHFSDLIQQHKQTLSY